jgi:DNA-binding HxlR family transcriptional regulator
VKQARTYGQHCGIARALDLVGERWALLVIRELVLGPKRFTDLRAGLSGVATNVLTDRLKQLERDGVVRRRTLPPPAASTVYELTEYGRELEPTLLAFGRWGAKSLGPRGGKQLVRPEWFCVALKAFFQPEAARGVRATVDLDLDGERFAVRIDRGSLEISAGAPDASELRLTTDPQTLVRYLAGEGVPARALAADGDGALLERLPAIFAFAQSRLRSASTSAT